MKICENLYGESGWEIGTFHHFSQFNDSSGTYIEKIHFRNGEKWGKIVKNGEICTYGEHGWKIGKFHHFSPFFTISKSLTEYDVLVDEGYNRLIWS